MRMDLIIGRRVLKNGLVLATTIATCSLLHANEQEKSGSSPDSAGGPQTSASGTAKGGNLGSNSSQQQTQGQYGSAQPGQSGQHSQQQEKFVQKALKGGQMEVQMGQMAQQNAQNQEVKSLGQRLVQDHTQANQQLQQIAQSLNIQASDAAKTGKPDDHAKHEHGLSKLQGKTGAEFDKEFTKMALKHHRKDIQEFERAQNEVQDPQLKSFIQQTLPKLRQHLQMAQSAARSLGVDESSIAADESDSDATDATGAPAAAEQGQSQPDQGDQQSSAIDQSTDVNAEIEADDRSASVEIDTESDTDKSNKLFRKGDGKVLGLSTDKNDGKILGILPAPGGKDDDADIEADVEVNDSSSVGAPAESESGEASDRGTQVEVEADVDKK